MASDKLLPLYVVLGKEQGIRRLVQRFYDLMDSEEKAAAIRAMHPDDLTTSRKKTYLFLLGWSGGPQLYMQKYGHPRLRARHMPFAIDSDARDAWMHCMGLALREQVPDDSIRESIEASFWNVANFMRNTKDPE